VFKPETEQQERRLDGITCFITNLSRVKCSSKEAINYYRSKNKVEEAFHKIKAHINLRPLHLTRSQRIKAHVTACILAYFLAKWLKPLLRLVLEIFTPNLSSNNIF